MKNSATDKNKNKLNSENEEKENKESFSIQDTTSNQNNKNIINWRSQTDAKLENSRGKLLEKLHFSEKNLSLLKKIKSLESSHFKDCSIAHNGVKNNIESIQNDFINTHPNKINTQNTSNMFLNTSNDSFSGVNTSFKNAENNNYYRATSKTECLLENNLISKSQDKNLSNEALSVTNNLTNIPNASAVNKEVNDPFIIPRIKNISCHNVNSLKTSGMINNYNFQGNNITKMNNNRDYNDSLCGNITDDALISSNFEKYLKKKNDHSRHNSKGSKGNKVQFLDDFDINEHNYVKTSHLSRSIRAANTVLDTTNLNGNTSTNVAWLSLLKKARSEINSNQHNQQRLIRQRNSDHSNKSDLFATNTSNIMNNNSILSDLDNQDYNNILTEGNFNNFFQENLFFNCEAHSILPFLLLTSREIHRMCMSDYEVKLMKKNFRTKIINRRDDWIDYYKLGRIKIYQARYFDAFNLFKEAELRKNDDLEIKKWICFCLLILVFCVDNETILQSFEVFSDIFGKKKQDITSISNNDKTDNVLENERETGFNSYKPYNYYTNYFLNSFKINFYNLDKIQIKNEDIDYSVIGEANAKFSNSFSEAEEKGNNSSLLFGCCNSRKEYKPSRYYYRYNLNQTHIEHLSINNEYEIHSSRVNKYILAEELEMTLNYLSHESVKSKMKTPYDIEINWIYLIISIFIHLNPKQNCFSCISSPKFYIRKIKDLDAYLGYLAYTQYNCLVDKNFNPENIFIEIMERYPKRYETLLFYWNFLTKSNQKDFTKAFMLSEIYMKNLPNYHIEHETNKYMYVVFIYAKSYHYLNNTLFTITLLQKEYPVNFMNPSIYFMYAKYCSKIEFENLNYISISSLSQIKNILQEDLYYESQYLIGNVYYKLGYYDKCYKKWISFYDNINRSFCSSIKKITKVKNFLTEYYSICRSITKFKHNLKYIEYFYRRTVSTTCGGLYNLNNAYSNNNINSLYTSKNLNTDKSEDIVNNRATDKLIKAYFNDNSIHEEDYENQIDLKNFFLDFDTLYKYQPNLNENYLQQYEYYRALIHMCINKNTPLAINILTNIITNHEYFIPAYISLWKLIKRENNKKLLLSFSFFLIKISHNDEVSIKDLIYSYILYSKALCFNDKIESALEILRYLLEIFPCFPIEDLKYVEEIQKNNKISFKNNLFNHEIISRFYSRLHIYEKCEPIFQENSIFDKPSKEDIDLYDFPNLVIPPNYFGTDTNKEQEKHFFLDNPQLENFISNDSCKSNNSNNLPSTNEEIFNKSTNPQSTNNINTSLTVNNNIISEEQNNEKNYIFKIENDYKKNLLNAINNVELNICNSDYYSSSLAETNKSNPLYTNTKTLVLDEIQEEGEESSNIKITTSNNTNLNISHKEEFQQIIEISRIVPFEDENEDNQSKEIDSNYLPVKKYFLKDKNIYLRNYGIDDFTKLTKFLNTRIKKLNIDNDTTFITIITDIEPLYQMGKLCAKTNYKVEMGLLCLKDYMRLLKFKHDYDYNTNFEHKKLRVKFFKAVLLIILKQYNNAYKIFQSDEMKTKLKFKASRNKFLTLFLEFFRKFEINEVKSFYYDAKDIKAL